MTNLLIVYFSRTGGAHQMAQAAYEAASVETETILKRAGDADEHDVLAADGYLFVCPENLAAIAGEMKEFFDRTYYPVLGRIEGHPYGQMICAGSDGENAVRQIARIATGWRLKVAQEPIIVCTHAQTREEILAAKTIPENELARCAEMGAAMGAGLSMGVF